MSNLQDLFSKSEAQFSSRNASLKYQEKSLNETPSSFQSPQQVDVNNNNNNTNNNEGGPVFASVVILYRYENSNPIDLGKKGAAIVPNKDNNSNSYCLICYEIKNRKLLLSITIHNNFILNVLNKNFISFYDSKSNYFSMRFPNDNMLQKFVYSIAMTKIPKIIPFNNDENILIQDLNQTSSDSTISTTSVLNTHLQIWLCDIKKHPYHKGKCIYNSDKIINLNSDKILPALSMTLKKSSSLSVPSKKLIITSHHYGFGGKGNKSLNVPPSSPLIIQIDIKSIIESNENNDNNHNNNNNNNNNNVNIVNNNNNNNNDDKMDKIDNISIASSIDDSNTRQRMAKLSAATGGAMLATLIGGHNNIKQPSISSNASITSETMVTEGLNSSQQIPPIPHYYQPQPQPQPQSQPQPHPQPQQQRLYSPQPPPPQTTIYHHHHQHQRTVSQPPSQYAPSQPSSSSFYSTQKPQHHQSHQQEISLSLLYSKLNDISFELENLSKPQKSSSSLNKISAKDIISCLNEMNGNLQENKKEIESTNVEIKQLNEEINLLKTRNHQLLEKNNNLMEQQYKSMSSTHDESLKLRKENIEYQNNINLIKQENEKLKIDLNTIKLDNETMKEKLNNLLINLNEKQTEITLKDENLKSINDQNKEYLQQIQLLQNEMNSIKENQNQNQEENDNLLIEKNQIINNLQTEKNEMISNYSIEKEKYEKEMKIINNDKEKYIAKYKQIEIQLNESKNESIEILNQCNNKIEKIKKKFQIHQIDLIKRILQFVYIKFDENIKQNDDNFNHISFFRSITKEILANPHGFDDEDDDDDDDDSVNGEEDDDEDDDEDED